MQSVFSPATRRIMFSSSRDVASRGGGLKTLCKMWSSTFFNKTGNIAIPFTLSGEKRFQMSSDDTIKWVFFRIARPVGGVDGHEGIGDCNWTRNPLHNCLSNFHHRRHRKIRLDRDNRVAFVSYLPTSPRSWALICSVGRRMLRIVVTLTEFLNFRIRSTSPQFYTILKFHDLFARNFASMY